MALSYSTIFAKLGKLASRSNSYKSLATTTLPADVVAIMTQFGVSATQFGDAQGPLAGLTNTYIGMQNQVSGWSRGLLPYFLNTLTDQDTVTSQLTALTATDPQTVLAAIIQDMIDNAQTVKFNAVTIGTITYAATNHGNGKAIADATLDGFNIPIANSQANINYNGLLSQLCVPSETMQLVCTADSFTGSRQEGGESWSWAGGIKYQQFDYRPEGSGSGGSLVTANQETSLIQNLNFENFSVTNTPDNFVIAAGAAGVDIFQELSVVFRGASALRFTGTGSAQPAITQAMTPGALSGRRRYLFTIQMRKGGSAPGAGNITIKLTGTGYSAASSEKIDIALTSLTTSYALYSFYVNLPAQLPADIGLSIAITGANLASGAFIYFDSGTFTSVNYFGGLNAQVMAGSIPWVKGDRISWTVVNTVSGLCQDFVRRALYAQLPSVSDGSQTINDGAWS